MRFTTPLALVFGLAATVAAVPQYEDQHLLSNFYNMVDHKGRATWYEPGLGACGFTSSRDQLIVAISQTLFNEFLGGEPNPNKNKVCRRKIEISYGGKKVTVQVVDSCPGCKRDDLDLSPAAFKKLNNLDAGQMQVTWKFLA